MKATPSTTASEVAKARTRRAQMLRIASLATAPA